MEFNQKEIISYKENQRILQSVFKPTEAQLAIQYVGIIDLSLTNFGLDEAGLELGIYFFFMILCMYAILDKTQGDTSEIRSYLAYRKLEIFHSQVVNTPRVQIILLMGGLTYLVYPFIALLVWFIINIIDKAALKQSVISAIAIILVGLSYTLIVQNFMTIKWNSFKFSPLTIVFVFFAVISLTIYQGLVIFGYDEDPKFLPYSSFFLIFNFIILTIFVFFDKYSESKDILYIMQTNFPKSGLVIDRKRENILSDEIESQRADPKWKCTFEDLTDFISVSSVSFETFQAMIGGNIVQRFNQKGKIFKNLIKYSLLFLALVILAVYAFILYRYDNSNKTGIIVAIAVSLLDIWTYFLVISEVIEKPMFIISFLLLNRVLMIGLGEWYWVYGIMILYLVYSIFFTYEIARQRFPSDGEVLKKKQTMQQIMQADKLQQQNLLRQKICQPELLYFIVNVVYIGLLFAVQFGEWQGKRIWPFIVNKGFRYQKVLGSGYLALLTAGIALSVFLIIAYFKTVLRKMTKTETASDYAQFFGQVLEKTPRLKFCYSFFSTMVILSFLIFLFSIGWMIISWWLMRDLSVFVWGICLPIMVLSYIRGLVYFHLNYYEVFEDVKRLNIFIDNHNQKIKEQEIKSVEIKKKLADGTLFKIENRRSTLYNQTQQELEKIETVTLDDTDTQKNNRLLKLMEREEQRKKAEHEAKLKNILENESLMKQEQEEKIKMRKQITLEKEREKHLKQKLEKEKVEKQEKQDKIINKKTMKFLEEADKDIIVSQNIQNQNQNQQSSQQPQEQRNKFQGQALTGGKIEKIMPTKNDDIYEGGSILIPGNSDQSALLNNMSDKQSQIIQTKLDEDSQEPVEIDKIYLNLDEAVKEFNGYQQIAVTRLKRVTNWRILHDNKWYKAFFAGELRPNDYKFMSSMFLAFVAWACLLGGLLGTTSGALGAVIVIPIAYIGVGYVISASVLYQSRAFTWKELIAWIIKTIIYFGLSLAYFFLKFEIKKFKFTLNQRPPEQMDATYFLFFYVLCVPTAIHLIVCVIRIRERGFEGFLENFKYFISVVVVGLLLLVISCFLFVSAVQGAILIGSLMLVMFIISQIFMYIQNGFAMTPFWQYFNGIIAFIMVFAPFVASFCTSQITLYQGISMSTAISVGILWVYAGAHFLQDFYELKQRPIYFSQSLYPIYKFNDKTKDVEKHYKPITSWIIGLVILMMWSLLTNTQVTPRWFGAFLTIVIEAIIILTLVLARTLSITAINDASNYMNEKISKSAWLYTKECYYKQMGALSASHILSYRRLWKQRYFLKQYGRCLKKKQLFQIPKDISEELVNEVAPPQGTTDLKQYFKSKIEGAQGKDVDFESVENINTLGILLENKIDDSFIEEFKQIVRFVMIANSNSLAEKEAEKKEFFRFLNEKQDILLTLGLRIHIPKTGSLDSQYLSVMSQVENFNEEDLEVFRQVEKLSKDEVRVRRELQEAANEAERKIQEERNKIQEELQRKRQEQIRLQEEQHGKLFQEGATNDAQIDINLDIDKMPDCRYKYQIIVKKAKERKEKFVDKQFVAGDEALGQNTIMNSLSNAQRKWIRVSDNKNDEKKAYSIFKGGASYDDVEQGMLGDCYLISSLAVLGNQNTKNLFVFLNSEDEFNMCGAFCIKFQVGGNETIIIIDDYFCQVNDDFPFAKAPDGELWPMIIEKAYAKLYGKQVNLFVF